MNIVLTKYRGLLAVIAALVVPVVITAVLVPFRQSFANAASALVLIAFIVAIAVLGNRGAGLLASAWSALWFNFFLTAPYLRFVISGRADIETAIGLFVVGVIVTELAARSRYHSKASEEGAAFISMISDLSTMASGTERVSAITGYACHQLNELLCLRACRFETVHNEAEPPLPRLLANGDVAHLGLSWPADDLGIPGPEAEIVAAWRGLGLGRFILTPTPGLHVSIERRVVAVALGNIVAATLNASRRVA